MADDQLNEADLRREFAVFVRDSEVQIERVRGQYLPESGQSLTYLGIVKNSIVWLKGKARLAGQVVFVCITLEGLICFGERVHQASPYVLHFASEVYDFGERAFDDGLDLVLELGDDFAAGYVRVAKPLDLQLPPSPPVTLRFDVALEESGTYEDEDEPTSSSGDGTYEDNVELQPGDEIRPVDEVRGADEDRDWMV